MNLSNFNRFWTIAGGMAIAAAALAQDEVKVTFSEPTMKASAVLEAIMRQTGVLLTADSIVGDIPILVSVEDAPLGELLDRISQVTGGALKPEGNGYRLVNDRLGRQAEERLERQWTIEAFERARKKQLESNIYPNLWTAETVDGMVKNEQGRREQLRNRILETRALGSNQALNIFHGGTGTVTPARASALRALKSIRASTLASIGPGDRVVYSTRPTRMQKRMPLNTGGIVRDFIRNHNLLAQRSAGLRQDQSIRFSGGLNSAEPIEGIGKMYVILSRGQRSSTVQIEVKFADTNGLFVGQGYLSVTPDYGPRSRATSDEGEPIELSRLSREMAVIMAQESNSPTSDRQVFRVALGGVGGRTSALIVSSGSDNLPKKFSDELMQAFVNPDKYDPTGFYTAESYMQAAKASGKNLVATFPDSVVTELAIKLVQGRLTTKGLIAASPGFGLKVEEEEGWMTVTPTWPAATRNHRFDRDEAAKLFRSVSSRGYATLDELADYSFHLSVGSSQRTLDMIYLSLINKDVADLFSQYVNGNLDLLRLYASLPQQLKRSVGEDMRTRVGRLPRKAKVFAERAAYRPGGMTYFSFGGQRGRMTAMISRTVEQGAQQRQGLPGNSILREPTESMPNGLPAEATLVFGRTIEDGVLASATNVRGGRMMTAPQLGMQQSMLANIVVSGAFQQREFNKFVLAQIADISIAIDLGEFGRPSARFQDAWLVRGARALTYPQLPEGFRAMVDRTRKSMSSLGDLRFGGARRQPPPAP
ncbi:MAG: hypothetical protein IH945_12530 [Armatimonadetes bacterium]|nr:hypothetical protein [Armatimonadota bacterium]